jgi:transposase-like protein
MPRLGSEGLSEIEGAVVCPYCGKQHIVKHGFDSDGITRHYKCKECNRTFKRTTNSVVSHSHKSGDAWGQFILLTMKGSSLETCSKRCGISKTTAFAWRHKLLSALAESQFSCK